MRPRDYQLRALAAILEALQAVQSCLVVLPTGTGKTVLFGTLARDWPEGRVLVLAHTEELVDQAIDKLRMLGVQADREMAGSWADRGPSKARVIVASIPTLAQDDRRSRFPASDFGLVVVDEAHHAVAGSWRRTIAHFAANPACKVVGVTATPRRGDDQALGQVFERMAYELTIEQAIDDGWLVPIRQQAVRVEGLDFSQVRNTAGDLNEGDLERLVMDEKHLHQVAAPTVELAGDRPTLVFCVTVAHAQELANVLNRYRSGSAIALHGDQSAQGRANRRQVVADFKAGKLQFLCNCMLFTEGFDAPVTANVVMARPTKKLGLYLQVLGRGTRPLPGVVDGLETAQQRRDAIVNSDKPYMTVLDFVGNSGRHKIVTAVDALGGRYSTAVRERAARTITSEGGPASVEAALERADVELAWLAKLEEIRRRRQVVAQATYTAAVVSPFAGGRSPGGQRQAAPLDPPTEKQVWFLVKRCNWRESAARAITKRQASAIIGRVKGGDE